MKKKTFILIDCSNVVKCSNEKKLAFVFLRLVFYQRPHHKPASQLIWIEIQPTSFHTYGNGVGKLQDWWGIIFLLKVCEWFFCLERK